MTALRPDVTRTGGDQVVPSADRESTTSFAVQPVLKRQSCQTTTTRPSASTSAAIRGGERRGARIPCADVGDRHRAPEADAAVGRGDGDHAGAARPEREHELAVRLHDRDRAGDGDVQRHRLRPGPAAVVGALQREVVLARADQRVREVTAAAVRTRRAVVAGQPVLVVGEVGRPRQCRVGREAPRETVRRAVDRQAGCVGCDRERVRQPDAVCRVVGDDRIARARRRSPWRSCSPSARAACLRARYGRRPSRSRSRCLRRRRCGCVRPGTRRPSSGRRSASPARPPTRAGSRDWRAGRDGCGG